MAAGVRVNEMFAPHTCHGPELQKNGSGRLIVSVCEYHERNAELFLRLTEDGIVIRERVVLARRMAISQHDFKKRVEDKAFEIWNREVRDRKKQNWEDAWGLCLRELERIPSFNERGIRAECLHEERKTKQALDDWFAAEREISARFTIV